MIIVAPLPTDEAAELFFTLVAKTLAWTLVVKLKDYGADVNTDRGIMHCVAEITELSVPSQLTVSSL